MIEDHDLDRLKEIFVTRRECETSNDEIKKKLSSDSTELALIKAQLNTIAWVAKTTLASVIGAIVVYIASVMLH